MSLLSCVVSDFSYAQTCTAAPSCSDMGYTKSASDCAGKNMIKCPFDLTKVNCDDASSSGSSKGVDDLDWNAMYPLPSNSFTLSEDGCFVGSYTTVVNSSTVYDVYLSVDNKNLYPMHIYNDEYGFNTIPLLCLKKGQVIKAYNWKLFFVPYINRVSCTGYNLTSMPNKYCSYKTCTTDNAHFYYKTYTCNCPSRFDKTQSQADRYIQKIKNEDDADCYFCDPCTNDITGITKYYCEYSSRRC